MNILIMDWPAFGGETVKTVFRDMGHKVSVFDFPHKSPEAKNGEELGVRIVEKILKEDVDLVFSFNYFPVIATAVQACRKKYVSWVYDSPAIFLYSMTIFFSGNYIFHFDSYEVERMRRDGVEHVYYLPLAANVEDYDAIRPSEQQRKKYSADIAMIGSLYSEKYAYFDKYTRFDRYMQGFIDGLVKVQEQLYGVNILEKALTPEIMKRLLETVPLIEEKEDGYDTPEWAFANYYLGMRVTEQERMHLLETMSKRYDVALYTGSKSCNLKRIRNMGSVEYYHEAPLAIKCAKINLNVTLRSIQKGIPLRILDIMGCGGFVLSNYQEDLCTEFVADEDFVFYESIEDAVEKAGYYLVHEQERIRIAQNGYRKVKSKHNFGRKCRQIIKVLMDHEPD